MSPPSKEDQGVHGALHPFGCAPAGCWATRGHLIPALNLTLSLLSRPTLIVRTHEWKKKKPQHTSKQPAARGGQERPRAAIAIPHAGALAGWP